MAGWTLAQVLKIPEMGMSDLTPQQAQKISQEDPESLMVVSEIYDQCAGILSVESKRGARE